MTTDFSRAVGTLPEIEYGGIENTCDTIHHKTGDYFLDARVGSGHVARAIYKGLRGAELKDALKMDFGCWMVASPDQ